MYRIFGSLEVIQCHELKMPLLISFQKLINNLKTPEVKKQGEFIIIQCNKLFYNTPLNIINNNANNNNDDDVIIILIIHINGSLAAKLPNRK